MGSTGTAARAGAFQHTINNLENRMNNITTITKKISKGYYIIQGNVNERWLQRTADGPSDTN